MGSRESFTTIQFAEEGYTTVHVAYPDASNDLASSLDAAGEYVRQSGRLWAIATYGLLKDGSLALARLVSAAGEANLCACIHYAPQTDDPVGLLLRRDEGQYIE